MKGSTIPFSVATPESSERLRRLAESRTADSLLVIGAGPSARLILANAADNLGRLPLDSWVIGASYRFFGHLGWYPTYCSWTDSKTVRNHSSALQDFVRTAPASTRALFLPIEEDGVEAWSHRIVAVNHESSGTLALRAAGFLGYRRIFLIGLGDGYTEEIPGSDELLAVPSGMESLPHLQGIRMMTDTPVLNPNYWNDAYQVKGDVYSKPRGSGHLTTLNVEISRLLAAGVRVLQLSPISDLSGPERFWLGDLLSGDAAS